MSSPREQEHRSHLLQLAVIDPATHRPELDCYNQISLSVDAQTSYHLPALAGMESLERLERTPPDGIILLGSGASVHDELPWQRPFHRWIYERALGGVPLLAICYGHQLLAHLFRGRVELLWEGEKVRGRRSVRISSSRLLPEPLSGPLIVSHREGVTVAPEGFKVIGVSDAVAIDAIEHEQLPLWGFQPDIEATEDFLRGNQIPLEAQSCRPAFNLGERLLRAFWTQVEARAAQGGGRAHL